MARLFLNLSNMLIISRKSKSVRKGVLVFFNNILVFAAIIFTLEIILIFLGIGDIFIPLTRSAREFISNWFF